MTERHRYVLVQYRQAERHWRGIMKVAEITEVRQLQSKHRMKTYSITIT